MSRVTKWNVQRHDECERMHTYRTVDEKNTNESSSGRRSVSHPMLSMTIMKYEAYLAI